MSLEPEPQSNWTYRPSDWIAYTGIGVFTAIYLAWIAYARYVDGFIIFRTWMLMSVALPLLGLIVLIACQSVSSGRKFSPLANAIALMALAGWAGLSFYILVSAAAAV